MFSIITISIITISNIYVFHDLKPIDFWDCNLKIIIIWTVTVCKHAQYVSTHVPLYTEYQQSKVQVNCRLVVPLDVHSIKDTVALGRPWQMVCLDVGFSR